jgi:hypothetical protein
LYTPSSQHWWHSLSANSDHHTKWRQWKAGFPMSLVNSRHLDSLIWEKCNSIVARLNWKHTEATLTDMHSCVKELLLHPACDKWKIIKNSKSNFNPPCMVITQVRLVVYNSLSPTLLAWIFFDEIKMSDSLPTPATNLRTRFKIWFSNFNFAYRRCVSQLATCVQLLDLRVG